MKKTIVVIAFFLAAAALFSCRKYTSIENGEGIAPDFSAVINGTAWTASDSTQSAAIIQGVIYLTGTSADGRQLSITLGGAVVGIYPLGNQLFSLSSYTELVSSNLSPFFSDEGNDTSLAGGTVTVTSIDPINKTISGVFSFNVFRQADSLGKKITSGVFYKLPYTTPLSPGTGNDTLKAGIDGIPWTSQNIIVGSTGSSLTISGSVLNGDETIFLLLPANATPGSYPLAYNGSGNYLGLYDPFATQAMVSDTGTLTVLENNTISSRIRGNFQFLGSDPSGSGAFSGISNGYFSVYYGQ